MEDFDNAKTRNPKECVVTNLNSYLTYISDIKETIKKEEGAEVSTKHYFFRDRPATNGMSCRECSVVGCCHMKQN